MKLSSKIVAILLFVVLAVAAARAQQSPQNSVQDTMSHLRVDILLTEYDGAKKISSLPYTLYVGVTDPQHGPHAPSAFLRMGVKVPVATTPVSAAKGSQITNYNFQYENVGTNIDVDATKLDSDLYRLQCTVERTAVSSPHQGNDSGEGSGILPLPTLTNFNSRFELSLRDGQEGEGMSATDPFSGHVMKINVTMHVLK